MDNLLEVRDLKIQFATSAGMLPAVDGVSFHVKRGESLGIVGESGCGKTVTSLSIMRLVAVPPGRYVGGEIIFEGQNLLDKSEAEMRKIRGNEIAMIFQEPMTSLNPLYTIGDQIAEAVQLHRGEKKEQAMARAVEMLRLAGVPDPVQRSREYPHQMSGGMRQRVMIGMALCCNPKLLIADEPTTALDVTVQAQILDLIKRLKREIGTATILIAHDLGVIAEMAERVAVMYAGQIVEEAGVKELFRLMLHPYTEGLFRCIPRIDKPVDKLAVIEGVVPSPLEFPPGCRFHPRCAYAQDICRTQAPEIRQLGARRLACHFLPQERRPAEVA